MYVCMPFISKNEASKVNFEQAKGRLTTVQYTLCTFATGGGDYGTPTERTDLLLPAFRHHGTRERPQVHGAVADNISAFLKDVRRGPAARSVSECIVFHVRIICCVSANGSIQ